MLICSIMALTMYITWKVVLLIMPGRQKLPALKQNSLVRILCSTTGWEGTSIITPRLGERITEDIIAKCHQCGQPADTHTNCKNDGCHLLFIQCEECAKKYDGCCTVECQTVYNLPVEEQVELRKGIDKGMMVFNKSKKRLRPTIEENKLYKQ